MSGRKESGEFGEGLAVSHLLSQGFTLAERNWRPGREGEIDIIAYDREVLVFIEVKTRFNDKYGEPLQAVTNGKRKQMAYLAKRYLYDKQLYGRVDCRFDVIGIKLVENQPQIEHIKDAFRL
jgi:putative endonuclease